MGKNSKANMRCPCGSGKKFKKCCMLKDANQNKAIESSIDDFNYPDKLNASYYFLDEKVTRVMSVFEKYRKTDLIIAVFALASWRDNRSAQESLLALNKALVTCLDYGTQTIVDYNSFVRFFQEIEPLLKVTKYDDWITSDFGEIQLEFNKRFYPIITGTGHTRSVYSTLQYLEQLALGQKNISETEQILCYYAKLINHFKSSNSSQYEEVQIVFDVPTKQYFEKTKAYFAALSLSDLSQAIIDIFTYPNQPITKAHFIELDGSYYPLFNPTFILDYYIYLLERTSAEGIKKHIHSALLQKLKDIYVDDTSNEKCVLIHQCKVLIDGKKANILGPDILFARRDAVVLFVDTETMEQEDIKSYMSEIMKVHTNHRLGFLDIDRPTSNNQIFGIEIASEQTITVIPFNHYTNLDQEYMQLLTAEDVLELTAVDLMFLLCVSESIDEIIDFLANRLSGKTRIISLGGIPDQYTVWKEVRGDIAKGAVEYNLSYIEADMSAGYIYDRYVEWQKCFPFHLSNMDFGFPEQWIITLDDNNVYQFKRKNTRSLAGAMFMLDNGATIFFSYDYFSIMKDLTSAHEASYYLDLVQGLNERFIQNYQSRLETIEAIRNRFINILCSSFVVKTEASVYVEILSLNETSGEIAINYAVNCSRLVHDISESHNRSVESDYILSLLAPLTDKYSSVFQETLSSIMRDSEKKKTVNTDLYRPDFYVNLDFIGLTLSEESLQAARKAIAIVAKDSGIIPGEYKQKEATKIVRKMQKALVNYFENNVIKYDRLTVHSALLSYYAAHLASSRINYKAYGLTEQIDESIIDKNKEKLIKLREKSKQMQSALLYAIETNLYIETGRDHESPNESTIEQLVAFAYWLDALQSNSDLCFHTTAETTFVILDDYRVNVEFDEAYWNLQKSIQKRQYEANIFDLENDEEDKVHYENVIRGFKLDTGLDFRVLEVVLRQLMEYSFPEKTVEKSEIKPNVVQVRKTDAVNDCIKFVANAECISIDSVQNAYDFITIYTPRLKTIRNTSHPILPVWERKNRSDRFNARPLLSIGDSYIYSPIMIKELHERWVNGWFQFYPPFEIGLDNALCALWNWKTRYEQLFSLKIRDFFKEMHYDYAEAEVDLRRQDRKGNHPSINILGDYDVIALDVSSKRIFIIECKFLQPIGSVFEHSKQQENFFKKHKYDEKFQKRIDYLSHHYRTLFENLGFDLGNDSFMIESYMVTNKVFASFYKLINFPIVTYDELLKILKNGKCDDSLN